MKRCLCLVVGGGWANWNDDFGLLDGFRWASTTDADPVVEEAIKESLRLNSRTCALSTAVESLLIDSPRSSDSGGFEL